MKPVKQIMEFPFTVEAPWPHVNLSPNESVHWRKLGTFKAKHKAACMSAFMGQGLRRIKLSEGATLRVTLTFTPPVTRSHDHDNLVARCKALLDALAATIGVDDSRFRLQPITIVKANRQGAKVTITVERAEG